MNRAKLFLNLSLVIAVLSIVVAGTKYLVFEYAVFGKISGRQLSDSSIPDENVNVDGFIAESSFTDTANAASLLVTNNGKYWHRYENY